MDILQLEHFMAVVEEKSFSRAAERVFRTQPTISQSIKKLEDEVGAPLFARDMQEIVLTEAGRLLLDYARRILHLRDQTMHAMEELKVLNRGALSIAAPESAALYLIPGPLQEYLKKYPAIKVGIFRRRMDEIPCQVMDREVDVGFVLSEPSFKDIHCLPIYKDEMVLIAPPEHPITKRKEVKISDLGSEKFVFHHLCTPTWQNITEVFARHNTSLNVAAELWGYEIIKDFVRQGVGLAIVPQCTVLQELRNGTLTRVPVRGLRIPKKTFVIFRDPCYMTDAAQAFLKAVTSFRWSHLKTIKRIRRGPHAVHRSTPALRASNELDSATAKKAARGVDD
jgi:DNA-binding transcriptional LysR family regulator